MGSFSTRVKRPESFGSIANSYSSHAGSFIYKLSINLEMPTADFDEEGKVKVLFDENNIS